MPERQPPRVSAGGPIGPEVDLERDDIRLADGTWLTPDIAAGIGEDVRRAAGRPSLTGPGRHSPQVSARVAAELRDAAEQQARREGKSVSQLIRELLERYLSGSPDGVRH
jgi:Ribbon-helix-helix protein, copG family